MANINSENTTRYRQEVLLITTIGAFMAPLDASIVSVALPSIASTFNIGYEGIIWVPVAYLLSLATLLLAFGKLSDIKGRKKLFTAGFALFTAASALCGISQSGEQLIIFRIIQGISAAMIGATSAAIVTDVFPPEKRGKALGINVLAVYTGLAVGPTLGGVLVQSFGWQSIFYVNVPIGILVSYIAATRLKESATNRKSKQNLDLLGVATFTVALSLILVGLTLTGSASWADPAVYAPLLSGAAVLTVFLAIELKRGENALLDLDLFRKNRAFAAGNFSALLTYTAYFAVPYFLSFFLQALKDLTPLITGLVLVALPLPMAFLSFSGWVSDKIGYRLLTTGGLATMAIALLLLSQLTLTTPLPYIVAALAMLGTGMGIFSAPNTSSVMGSVDKQHLGVASGTISTMRFVGQSLSLAIMGAVAATLIPPQVFAAIFGGVTGEGAVVADAFLKGANLAFLAGASIAFIGVVTSFLRGKSKSPPNR